MWKFIICTRAVVAGAFTTDLGPGQYLLLPDDALVPLPSHAKPLRDWLDAVLATCPATASDFDPHHLLCIVHGFDTQPVDVLARHNQIISGLADQTFVPTIVSFDWPSLGQLGLTQYRTDADVAQKSGVDFVKYAIRPMLPLRTPDCHIIVDALGHSLGAWVLREALDHADEGSSTKGAWTLGQTALVAGDIGQSDFVDGNPETESLMAHTNRLTNYFSRYDEALAVARSKSAGFEDLIGRVGLPDEAPAKAVNLDCSARYDLLPNPGGLDPVARAVWSHNFYFDDPNFYADLAATLRGAHDRQVIAGRTPADGRTMEMAT